MRVTKTVREYIEKQVSALFPAEKDLPEVIAYNALSKKREEMMESAMFELRALANARLKAINTELPDDFSVEEITVSYRTKWSSDCATRREAERAKSERKTAIKEAIDDIVVALKLGGTKDTLDKMLKELAERV